MGGGRVAITFRKVAGKLFFRLCGCFCGEAIADIGGCSIFPSHLSPPEIQNGCLKIPSETTKQSFSPLNKNMCAICLDPLNYSSGGSSGEAIFTAHYSHSFHLSCISYNVHHGSITCPICRAQWTQLPRNLNIRAVVQLNKADDPVLQILDDSISNSRFHRRSFLRSTRSTMMIQLILTSQVNNDISNSPYLVHGLIRGSTLAPRVSGSSSISGCLHDFSGEERFRLNPNKGIYLLLRLVIDHLQI